MKLSQAVGLASALILSACHSGVKQPAVKDQETIPAIWTFDFFTPKALPALVTFAVVQDADGSVYRFNTLNPTPDLSRVIGGWDDKTRAPGGHWNHVRRPPRHIIFCWDSVIDKQVYETHLTFPKPIIEKMLRPSEYKNYRGETAYYDRIQIGLAPQGKIAVWLQGSGSEDNYRVTPSVLYTLSADKLGICKDITRHPNGYEYFGDIKEFIKDKTYPYGSW